MRVQFETALKSFERRYHRRVDGKPYWITDAFIKDWEGSLAEKYNKEDGEREQ